VGRTNDNSRNSSSGSAWSLWQGLASALIGLGVLSAFLKLPDHFAIGAFCILWAGYTTWNSGLAWTCGLWVIGLGMGTWLRGRGNVSFEIDVGLLTLAVVGVGIWLRTIRQRLNHEHRQARLDHLTGLPNRQAFVERCLAELSRSRRFQRPFTLILLDGDQFKQLNDQQGHAAGDTALRATARILVEAVRQYDLVARLGGDEFVVLLPEIDPGQAELIATRLQTTLLSAMNVPLKFSQGVVTFYPGMWEVAECLDHADRLLYRAKRAGSGEICRETLVDTRPGPLNVANEPAHGG